MATHVERWILPRQHDAVIERVAIRHQRRRGENSVPMRFDNTFVYIARETEVVRIDDKTEAHASSPTPPLPSVTVL